MVEITVPGLLDHTFAGILRSQKADFVATTDGGTFIAQHGAARVETTDWPGWPTGLSADDTIIETFVAGAVDVAATSNNEPFVSAWQPIAEWMNITVRSALADVGVQLRADAYITTSFTPTDVLEGIAHLDDDQFVPAESVSMVAIVGEHAGPRVATTALGHPPLRPMAPIMFEAAQRDGFANNETDHCLCAADELVVFPQFGQLHAGPSSAHVANAGPARQLLVMRAPVLS
ncbi:MAG: hypothetical protein HOI41_01740 [Acidimicrobiaceae bacterium]|nr:hypothetical protein [Acidimicrobiaceae bacterium]